MFRHLREADQALGVGDDETAAECLEALEPLVARSSEPQWIGAFGSLQAELRRRQRDLAGARAAVTHALDRMELCTDDVMRIARVTAAGMRIEADIAQRARDLRERADERDAVARARIHMQRLRAAAQEGGTVEIAWRAVGTAELARARGKSDPALWIKAAREWEALSRPYVRAYSLWRAAEAYSEAGNRDAACDAAGSALADARRLGARWLEDELVTLGQRARLELGDEDRRGGAAAGPARVRRRRRGSVRPDRARAAGAGARRRGRDQPPDRRVAVHGREDRERARLADPRRSSGCGAGRRRPRWRTGTICITACGSSHAGCCGLRPGRTSCPGSAGPWDRTRA